jgi:hypothetical protein
VWPVECYQFGIDVCQGGATGNGPATVVALLLEGAGVLVWMFVRVIDEFVW